MGDKIIADTLAKALYAWYPTAKIRTKQVAKTAALRVLTKFTFANQKIGSHNIPPKT